MNTELQQLFNKYIDECKYAKGLRSETLRGYKESFLHFSKLMSHITTPSLLSSDVMTEFFRALQTRKRTVGRDVEKVGIKNSTVKTYASKLNTYFEWLRIRGSMVENPLSKMKLPKPIYNDERALRKDDIEKIVAAIAQHSQNALIFKRDMMMVHILLFCGLRKGEFISLQTRDIDLHKRMLTVRAETSKSKRERQIPLHPTVIMYIEEYLSELRKRGYKTQYLIVSFITSFS